MKHLSPRVHISTLRKIGIDEQTFVSSGEQASVLQMTKNVVESVQQIIFISPSPHDVINPELAVRAGQQLGHYTLEVGRRVQNALGHTRRGKQTFGGGDGEQFLGFGRQLHLPISLQHVKFPKHVAPRKSPFLLLGSA